MNEEQMIDTAQTANGIKQYVSGSACPFELGEIAVFESWFRFEKYISRVMQIHIDYYGQGGIPIITKATLEQKQLWYENGEYEIVIEQLHCH